MLSPCKYKILLPGDTIKIAQVAVNALSLNLQLLSINDQNLELRLKVLTQV